MLLYLNNSIIILLSILIKFNNNNLQIKNLKRKNAAKSKKIKSL